MSIHRHDNSIHHQPLFENMAALSDEAVWELLEMLHGLIDAYEALYAEPLQRLRHERYRQLHESWGEEQQMSLPMNEMPDDPF